MYPTPINNGSITPQTSGGLIWVQGEAGAKAYMVAPGNSVLLLDSEKPVFYIKSTDENGMPKPLKTYEFVERQSIPSEQAESIKLPATQRVDVPYITKSELEEQINEIKKYIDELLK